jgi:hypothetical protein
MNSTPAIQAQFTLLKTAGAAGVLYCSTIHHSPLQILGSLVGDAHLTGKASNQKGALLRAYSEMQDLAERFRKDAFRSKKIHECMIIAGCETGTNDF